MSEILHSRIYGEQPKHLLIFHGLFGQGDNFATLSRQFSEFYTVHAMDLRNHGRSFHSEDMSFDAMSRDILEYIDSKQISEAFLLGHSLGGRSVMEFACAYPERVEKLIVADMAPKAYPPHHQGVLKALNSVDFDKVQRRSDAEKVLKQYIPEAAVRQFLLKNVHMTESGKYAFRFNLKVLTDSYASLVETNLESGIYEKPVLFIRGGKSFYISDNDMPLIHYHFPKAELATIPNAGHWLHAENPEMFFDLVTGFLNN